MNILRHTIRIVLILTMLVSLLGVLAAGEKQVARVNPSLAQIAVQMPEQQVQVIVQKSNPSQFAESLVRSFGGEVKKNLPMIRAFSAELPAKAVLELAKLEDVRWITLDAPVVLSLIHI